MAEQVTPPSASGRASFYERNKLRIGGGLNLLGDATLLRSAIEEGKPFRIAGGTFYTVGATVLTFFGSVSPQRQFEALRGKLIDFLDQEAIGASPYLEKMNFLDKMSEYRQSSNSGTLANFTNFLRRKAADITLAFYTFGAGAMLAHGVTEFRKERSEGAVSNKTKFDIAYGLISLSIKLASLLIPEQKKREKGDDEAPKGFFNWIKEQPLRLFGYGSLVTEVVLAGRTVANYIESRDKNENKSYVWDAVTATAYGASDIIVATANKDSRNSSAAAITSNQYHELEQMMLQTIADQPESEQNGLIDKAAKFMADQPEIQISQEEITLSLRQQFAQLKQSSWVARTDDEVQPHQAALSQQQFAL